MGSTARAAERVGPWGCGWVYHKYLVRKCETECLYLKGTRTCDSLRLAHHPISGDQKFSQSRRRFLLLLSSFCINKIKTFLKTCMKSMKRSSECPIKSPSPLRFFSMII